MDRAGEECLIQVKPAVRSFKRLRHLALFIIGLAVAILTVWFFRPGSHAPADLGALEAGVQFASREQTMLATAANIGLMTMDLAYKFFEPVSELIRRGQDTGAFRTDLVPEDTPRLILMIAGTLPSFDPGSEGWRRYLDIVVDGLAPAEHNTKLAPPSPVREHHAKLPS